MEKFFLKIWYQDVYYANLVSLFLIPLSFIYICLFYIRALFYKKKYELAYKIASNHALSDGPEYAAAEWMSGWIALSFLDDPLLAKDHFENFYSNVGYPRSTSRGAYWLAKSYQKLGKNELANEWFGKAANFLTTYYGQLAYMELNPNKPFELTKDVEVSKE